LGHTLYADMVARLHSFLISANYPIAAILRDILSQILATFATGLYGDIPYLP
jgi:hypothetical protein